MNNLQFIHQLPYVQFKQYSEGFQVIKNKYDCSCKLCQSPMGIGSYALWKRGYGVICVRDCTSNV